MNRVPKRVIAATDFSGPAEDAAIRAVRCAAGSRGGVAEC